MSFNRYQSLHLSVPMSEQLKNYAAPHWQQAVTHDFTQQLGDDSLPDGVYARYLVQDYAFIETLVNLVARAIAAAPSMKQKSVLSGFLAALTSEENSYFLRSFTALGLAEEDYLQPSLTPVSQAIIREFNSASAAGYQDAIVALCCAEWIYLTWSKAQSAKKPARFYLREWIELHLLPEFETFVQWLRHEVDSFTQLDTASKERLAERFVTVASLEHQFFSASFSQQQEPA